MCIPLRHCGKISSEIANKIDEERAQLAIADFAQSGFVPFGGLFTPFSIPQKIRVFITSQGKLFGNPMEPHRQLSALFCSLCLHTLIESSNVVNNSVISKCNITFIMWADQSKCSVGVWVAFIVGQQCSQGVVAS